MSPEPRPVLRVLEGDHGTSAAGGGAEPEAGTTPGRPWLLFLLLAVVLVLGIGYGLERSRATSLEGQVVHLQAELGEARETLRAAEQRIDVVRDHVSDLASRIGLLQQALEPPLRSQDDLPAVFDSSLPE